MQSKIKEEKERGKAYDLTEIEEISPWLAASIMKLSSELVDLPSSVKYCKDRGWYKRGHVDLEYSLLNTLQKDFYSRQWTRRNEAAAALRDADFDISLLSEAHQLGVQQLQNLRQNNKYHAILESRRKGFTNDQRRSVEELSAMSRKAMREATDQEEPEPKKARTATASSRALDKFKEQARSGR